MPAFGGLFGSRKSKLTPEELAAKQAKLQDVANRLFVGATPGLMKAYQNDPRTAAANRMIEAGSSTAPMAGGVLGGLAQVGQGALGGILARRQQEAYKARDKGAQEVDEDAEAAARARTAMPVATGRPDVAGIMGGPTPPPPPVPPPGMPPPGGPPPPGPPTVTPNPAIAALAGGGGPGGPPPGMGNPNIAKIAGALGQGPPPGAGGLPPGGLPPPPGPVPGPDMATLTGTPTRPPMGTPPPNPMMAPGSPGAQAASSPNSLNRVAASLTAQPAMEDVAGLQAMPDAPPYLRRQPPVRSTVQGFPVAAQAVASVKPTLTYEQRRAAGDDAQRARLADQGVYRAPRSERRDAINNGRFGGKDDPYGSWGAVYGYGDYGRPDKPLPEKTIGEVIDFGRNVLIPATKAKGIGVNSKGEVVGTSAQGGLQFTASTLEDVGPRFLGKDYRTKNFTPDVQDELGEKLFNERKGGNLKDTWASLPDATPGAYANKSWADMRPIIMRGESGGAGSHAAGDTGAGIVAGNVPAPPKVDIPGMPDAPVEPTPQTLPQQLQSLRLAKAEELVTGRKAKGWDADVVGAQRQAEWEAGTKEEDAYKTQARADLVQQIRDTDTSRRALYNQEADARYKQPLAERTQALGQQNELQTKQYGAEVDTEAARALAENQARQAREHDASVERQRKTALQRMPAAMADRFAGNTNNLLGIQDVAAQIRANPSSVGTRFTGTDDWVNAKFTDTSEAGVRARAALSNLGSLVVAQRGGKTITANEDVRFRPFIPRPSDDADAVQWKLDEMRKVIERDQQTMLTMFGDDNPYTAGFSGVMKSGTASPNWGPTSTSE